MFDVHYFTHQEIIETGIHLLQMLVRDSQGVAGAGCFEMFAACLLAQMKEELVESLAKMFEASQAEVDMVRRFLTFHFLSYNGKVKAVLIVGSFGRYPLLYRSWTP